LLFDPNEQTTTTTKAIQVLMKDEKEDGTTFTLEKIDYLAQVPLAGMGSLKEKIIQGVRHSAELKLEYAVAESAASLKNDAMVQKEAAVNAYENSQQEQTKVKLERQAWLSQEAYNDSKKGFDDKKRCVSELSDEVVSDRKDVRIVGESIEVMTKKLRALEDITADIYAKMKILKDQLDQATYFSEAVKQLHIRVHEVIDSSYSKILERTAAQPSTKRMTASTKLAKKSKETFIKLMVRGLELNDKNWVTEKEELEILVLALV